MRVSQLLTRDIEDAVDLYLEGMNMATRTITGDVPYDICYAALRAPDSVWWTVLNDADEVVGLGGFERINWIDKTGEPYIAVREDARCKGLGKVLAKYMFNEGKDTLKIRRMQTIILSISPAIPLLEMLGFKREGTLSKIRKHNGEWVDAYMYAFVSE